MGRCDMCCLHLKGNNNTKCSDCGENAIICNMCHNERKISLCQECAKTRCVCCHTNYPSMTVNCHICKREFGMKDITDEYLANRERWCYECTYSEWILMAGEEGIKQLCGTSKCSDLSCNKYYCLDCEKIYSTECYYNFPKKYNHCFSHLCL